MGAPFGLTTEWDSGWVGRFHAIKSEVLTININPSIAWKVNEMFSVGAGINAMYIDAELTQRGRLQRDRGRRGPGGTRSLGAGRARASRAQAGGGRNCEGVATVKGDDWGWGWNLGAMINLSPQTRIGLAYRSTVTQKLGGDVSFSNRPALSLGVPRRCAPNAASTARDQASRYGRRSGLAHAFGPLSGPRRLHVDRAGTRSRT